MNNLTVFLNNGMSNDVQLLNCPFCGGQPEITCIGNDYSKKQTIRIKCRKCRAMRQDGILRGGDVLRAVSFCVDQWNARTIESDES